MRAKASALGLRTIRYRAPLGCRILPGHLVASGRGRRAYRVHSAELAGRRPSDEPGLVAFRLLTESVSRAALDEPDAVVHGLVWDSRGRKPRAT